MLKDGVLFRRVSDKQKRRPVLQLVVPVSKRAEFIAECHRKTNGGHRAFRTTLDRVQRRGFWMGWRRDVERYCRQCRDCSSFVCGRRLRRSGCFRSSNAGSKSKSWVDENASGGVIGVNGSQTPVRGVNGRVGNIGQTSGYGFCIPTCTLESWENVYRWQI